MKTKEGIDTHCGVQVKYKGNDPLLTGCFAIGTWHDMERADTVCLPNCEHRPNIAFYVQVNKVEHPWGKGWHKTNRKEWTRFWTPPTEEYQYTQTI